MKYFWIIFVLMVGCQNAGDISPVDPVAADGAGLTKNPSCDKIAEEICTMELSPALCATEGQSVVLYGWGQNPCHATQKIKKLACERHVPFESLNVSCRPDASEGACVKLVEEPLTCPQDPAVPTVCILEQYDDDTPWILSERIIVQGTSRCQAEHNIKKTLCKRNLKPHGFKPHFLRCDSFSKDENPKNG